MKLTILGNNGPYPQAGGACSGYLLRDSGTSILIDCGNGVLSNLQRFVGFGEIDAIILTHLHSDHMSDMMVLKYAVQIKKKRGTFDRNLSVYAPPEPSEEYRRLDVRDAFDLKALDNDLVIILGNMKVSFKQMKHPVMDFAVSVECGRKRFVFSGDTSWTEGMIDFARDADLLMLDSGLLDRDKTGNDVHLTAGECGIIAVRAGAKRLLLTHFWPEYDTDDILREAKANFKEAELSVLLKEYII